VSPVNLRTRSRRVVAEGRHIAIKARYVNAVILGSEERRLLTDDDILLPFG
jgi:hypothetical protein